jgi:hypothetical protein
VPLVSCAAPQPTVKKFSDPDAPVEIVGVVCTDFGLQHLGQMLITTFSEEHIINILKAVETDGPRRTLSVI